MLISVLFHSPKFNYLVLLNVEANNLLVALNYGISKITAQQHINWKNEILFR